MLIIEKYLQTKLQGILKKFDTIALIFNSKEINLNKHQATDNILSKIIKNIGSFIQWCYNTKLLSHKLYLS